MTFVGADGAPLNPLGAIAFQARYFTRDNKTGNAESCGDVVPPLRASESSGDSSNLVAFGPEIPRETAHALPASHDGSEDGTGRGIPLIASAVTAKWAKRSGGPAGDECQNLVTWPKRIAPSLTARFFNDQATRPHGVMVHWAQGGGEVEDETAGALRSEAEHNYQFLRQEIGVRRLTPRECERLQGFPDDFTLVDWPKARSPKDIEEMTAYFIASGWTEDLARELAKTPDGHRYKALGNSMATPVMQWLGARVIAAMVKCDHIGDANEMVREG